MITEVKTIEREVPKTVPIPIGILDKNMTAGDIEKCGCYK